MIKFAIGKLYQLLCLIPTHTKRYLVYKAYGTPEPGGDDNPLFGRSSSLEYYKKAVSYFVPKRISPLGGVIQQGQSG